MTRLLPIKTALGEAAALYGRQPTADQFAVIEKVLREQIVIDLHSGKVGFCYADGTIVEPADFVADALKSSCVATSSSALDRCSSAPEL